jgi:hypothetical protein
MGVGGGVGPVVAGMGGESLSDRPSDRENTQHRDTLKCHAGTGFWQFD